MMLLCIYHHYITSLIIHSLHLPTTFTTYTSTHSYYLYLPTTYTSTHSYYLYLPTTYTSTHFHHLYLPTTFIT